MVYVNSRGELVTDKPFYSKAFDYVYGLVAVFLLFFRTLIEPLLGLTSGRQNSNYRPGAVRSNNLYGNGLSSKTTKRFGGFGGSSADAPNAPPCSGGG